MSSRTIFNMDDELIILIYSSHLVAILAISGNRSRGLQTAIIKQNARNSNIIHRYAAANQYTRVITREQSQREIRYRPS